MRNEKGISRKMKKRIHQIAKEQGKKSQEILELAQTCGFEVITASSSLTELEEAAILLALRPRKTKPNPIKKVKSKKKAVSSKVQTVKSYSEKYEKKKAPKAKIPKVKTASKQEANRWFVLLLVFISSFLLVMGGVGIASTFRMNRLIRETNHAIHVLNQENQKQDTAIQKLQQNVRP
jgi:cell division protein FtsB